MTSEELDAVTPDFGEATYVCGRHQKNKVLIYTSRLDKNRVYEFMIATRYKLPGLVSWKCVSCSKIKNGYRNLGAVLNRKVPLILVDNDIIKEDPEKPLNAEHFCNGKDAVDAVLDRARIEFVHRHGNMEPTSSKIRETIHQFAREAAADTPIPLSLKDKRIVQRTLHMKCLPLLHGVKKRRRCKERKEEILNDLEIESEADPSTSSYVRPGSELTETPRKKARKTNKAPQPPASPVQHLMVRPLPPYQYTRPSPSLQIPQRNNYRPMMNRYDESEYVELKPDYGDEELISGDQQQVSYTIEL